MPSDLNKAIVCHLHRFIAEQHFTPPDDTSVSRYVHGISLALRKEAAAEKFKFLKELALLFETVNFPLLKVEAVLVLYQKWRWHPSLFSEFKLLNKRIRLQLDTTDFWLRVIWQSAADKPIAAQQKARLHLLICTINGAQFTKSDLEKYGLIINTILSLQIQEQHLEPLAQFLKKDPQHVFHTMIELIRRSIKNGLEPFEIVQLIERHFFQLEPKMAFSPELLLFFESLEKKLPPNYFFSFSRRFFGQLMSIHSANPSLFKDLQPIEAAALNETSFLKVLFANFMISGSFVRNYFRFSYDYEEQQWFMAELQGKSILNATDLPLTLSRKAAHYFRLLPYEFDLQITKSLVFSSIETQINDYNFAYTVAAALRNNDNLDFWVQTMVLLHKKGLEAARVMELMDYINTKVFVEQEALDLKHKSLLRLLNEMETWHAELRNLSVLNKAHPYNTLAKLDIPVFEMEWEQRHYVIKQLRKALDLFHEGRLLSHCVFSYRARCFRGESYIFSLRLKEEDDQETPLVTIEIVNGEVFQARGKFNRDPKPEEQRIIGAWAVANEFSY